VVCDKLLFCSHCYKVAHVGNVDLRKMYDCLSNFIFLPPLTTIDFCLTTVYPVNRVELGVHFSEFIHSDRSDLK